MQYYFLKLVAVLLNSLVHGTSFYASYGKKSLYFVTGGSICDQLFSVLVYWNLCLLREKGNGGWILLFLLLCGWLLVVNGQNIQKWLHTLDHGRLVLAFTLNLDRRFYIVKSFVPMVFVACSILSEHKLSWWNCCSSFIYLLQFPSIVNIILQMYSIDRCGKVLVPKRWFTSQFGRTTLWFPAWSVKVILVVKLFAFACHREFSLEANGFKWIQESLATN